MEEWTPTCLSPETPPGLTSPMQVTDQDGGVDTTHPSLDMPLVRPVVVKAVRPGWRSGHPLV